MSLVPKVRALSSREIENDAIQLLERHFPDLVGSPGKVDVLELWELLADDYGLSPGVAELSDGVEGMAWPDGRVEVTEEVYRGAEAGRGRPRFTMCHEAYHGLKHRKQIQNVLIDSGEVVLYSRKEIPTPTDPEWQANRFASFLLMPTLPMQLVVRDAAGRALDDVMYYFGVTKTAARIRIGEIEPLPETTYSLTKNVQRRFPF